MKWVQDKTGRFAKRPYFLPEELDEECERIIRAFLQEKYGKVGVSVKTDDLTVLIEQKPRRCPRPKRQAGRLEKSQESNMHAGRFR